MKKFSKTVALLLLFITVCATTATAATLVPGGQVIGLQLDDESVTVVGFHPELGQAALSAGVKKGDRLLSLDGKAVRCVEDVRAVLTRSDGQVELSVLRDKKTKNLSLAPAATADGPKLGLYLRQGTTGLGTVTYYDPDTGRYGALGHGVNSQDGQLLQLHKGEVYKASVFSVKKGAAGKPGQLLGQLEDTQAMGLVEKNTNQGVFGNAQGLNRDAPLPVAKTAQVHTGKATIRTTVEGCAIQEYSVEILKIYPNADDRCRNMLLQVTDPALLAATGGIVQGMSGSPIIQDGKLVGAVTHVLVNDPTTGYGIFIENMLDAAA